MVPVEKIIIHPEYRQEHKFDLALIKLNQSLKFGQRIRPICLPKFSFGRSNFRKGRVIGWGYHNIFKRKIYKTLQEVDLDLLDHDQCRQIYSKIKQEIIPSQICTLTKDKDACVVGYFIDKIINYFSRKRIYTIFC